MKTVSTAQRVSALRTSSRNTRSLVLFGRTVVITLSVLSAGLGFLAGVRMQEGTYDPHAYAVGAGALFAAAMAFVAFLLMLFAVLSIVADGHVWGVALPGGIPAWVGVVFVIVAFHLLTWPIKAMRRARYYREAGGFGCHPRTGLWDSFVWLAFVVVLIWLADHYSPQFHEALKNIPPVIHHGMDEVRAWWVRQ